MAIGRVNTVSSNLIKKHHHNFALSGKVLGDRHPQQRIGTGETKECVRLLPAYRGEQPVS